MSTKEIADNLNASVETVKWYRKRIRKKMDVKPDESLTKKLDEAIVDQ